MKQFTKLRLDAFEITCWGYRGASPLGVQLPCFIRGMAKLVSKTTLILVKIHPQRKAHAHQRCCCCINTSCLHQPFSAQHKLLVCHSCARSYKRLSNAEQSWLQSSGLPQSLWIPLNRFILATQHSSLMENSTDQYDIQLKRQDLETSMCHRIQ